MGSRAMASDSKNVVLKFTSDEVSGKLDELHLVIPKDVANDFRQVAKKLRMTPSGLFEEMVEIYKTTI